MNLPLQMLRENTRLFCRAQRQGIKLSLFVCIIVCAGLYWFMRDYQPFVFLGLLMLCLALRYVFIYIHDRYVNYTEEELLRWRTQCMYVNTLYGLVWGVVAPYLCFQLEGGMVLVALMTPVFLCVGSIPYLCYSYRAVKWFIWAVMLPVFIWLFVQQQQIYYVYAGVCLIFFFAGHLSSRKLYDLLTESLRFKFENLELSENLQKANAELRELSDTDSLTGIPNRRAFEANLFADLQHMHTAKKSMALLMMDIDHFKAVNDEMGHVVGDEVIRAVAQASLEILNRPFDSIARYGGEEFVITLPETDSKGAMRVAERIRQNIMDLDLSSLVGYKRRLTVSIGVTSRKVQRPDIAEQLIKEADNALYRAKQNGRNKSVLFSS